MTSLGLNEVLFGKAGNSEQRLTTPQRMQPQRGCWEKCARHMFSFLGRGKGMLELEIPGQCEGEGI